MVVVVAADHVCANGIMTEENAKLRDVVPTWRAAPALMVGRGGCCCKRMDDVRALIGQSEGEEAGIREPYGGQVVGGNISPYLAEAEATEAETNDLD